MKKIAIILAVVFAAIACEKPNTPELGIKVSFDDISGSWMLQSYDDGNTLADGAFQYLNIVRKTGEFQEYVKLDSQYPRKKVGRIDLSQDEEDNNIIRGLYTDVLSEEWSHKYVIAEISKTRMKWVAEDDPTVVLVYVKAEIPADILERFPEE